jgi:hypothetical protein
MGDFCEGRFVLVPLARGIVDRHRERIGSDLDLEVEARFVGHEVALHVLTQQIDRAEAIIEALDPRFMKQMEGIQEELPARAGAERFLEGNVVSGVLDQRDDATRGFRLV